MKLNEAKRFVEIWYACDTFEQVCQQLNMEPRKASNYAGQLRRKGLKLDPKPQVGRSRPFITVMTEDDWMVLRHYERKIRTGVPGIPYTEYGAV